MTGSTVSVVTASTAHREWASRPRDERYASVHALYDASRARCTPSSPACPLVQTPRSVRVDCQNSGEGLKIRSA